MLMVMAIQGLNQKVNFLNIAMNINKIVDIIHYIMTRGIV